MPFYNPYGYGSLGGHVWDNLYDRSEYYYDPLTGVYVRRRILSPVLRPAVVYGSPTFASSSASQQPSLAPAPPREITVTIPKGNPFTDGNHVINDYHNESRRARGLKPGIGQCSEREDARQIVDMMKQAEDANVRLAILQLSEEAQIKFVLSRLRAIGYNI